MQLHEKWIIKEPDGSETVWVIHYDENRGEKEIVVSNETHSCFVGDFELYEWRDRLEAVIYYYMRKSVISTQKFLPSTTFGIVPGPTPEEWFKSNSYQLLLKRIGK